MMKKSFAKIKKVLPILLMLVVMSSYSVFADAPPTKATDVAFFNNLMKLIGFGVLVVSAFIMGSMALRWAILHAKASHEDDPAKLSEYDSLIKKAVKNAILGLSGSIVGAILAFFV